MALRRREGQGFLLLLAIQRCGGVSHFNQLHQKLVKLSWRKPVVDNPLVGQMSSNSIIQRSLRSRAQADNLLAKLFQQCWRTRPEKWKSERSANIFVHISSGLPEKINRRKSLCRCKR